MEEPTVRKDNKNKGSIGQSSVKGSATGGVAGAARNAARFIVRQGGTRWYNGVNIFDKTVRSAKGYPKWYARIDLPTPKNPQAHINVNRAVTGLKDPHIPVTTATAQNAAKAGTALNYINKAAPVLTVIALAYDGYQIGKNVKVDKNNGSTRNTTKKVVTTAATWGGGYGGASAGAALGTAIFPGIGTMIGAIVGGVAGGIGGSIASDIASDAAMDKCNYDIIYPNCKICQKKFECRKFETGERTVCDDCEPGDDKKESERCTWCGTDSENLEKVEVEDEEVQLCETCHEVLMREIEGLLADSEDVPEEVDEDIWTCKKCGNNTSHLDSDETPTLLCKTCQENLANEILAENERACKRIAEVLNNYLTILECKWCEQDFLGKKEDDAKDFCEECEAERKKMRKK